MTQRRTMRLPNYDYRQPGSYFVTMCSYKHRCVFGNANGQNIELSSLGRIIEQCWIQVPSHFNDISLDEYVVMPNHFHGILHIDASGYFQNSEVFQGSQILANSLSTMLRSFKAAATKEARIVTGDRALNLWQRNYYEHVIRNEADLFEKQQYIINNPLKWELDRLYPGKT